MMATRRLARAHHEFRFGRRELAVLGAVFCLIASLVFVAGVVVGREMSRSKARAEVPRESRLTEPDGHLGGDTVKTAATRAEEKVTFYRTLTAPTQDLPQVGKPTVEERMVPKDEPIPTPDAATAPAPAEPRAAAPDASRTELEAPRAAPERKTPKAPAVPEAAHPTPRATRPARVSAPQPVRPPAQVAAASATSEPEMWTVQVNAFRSRALAEELRARLAARGFDAYVFPSLTEDGRPRYRVRVGAYPARNDAERAATELRSERGLNPLVTPRTTR
jgi:cell division septation protein DedD